LRNLDCSYNQLPNLDLSNNSRITQLTCSHNQLTALDLQNDSNLIVLYCIRNPLTSLDLSNTHVLILRCDSNQLVTLNLANDYNMSTITIWANNNPQLECVQVDSAAYSTAHWTGALFLFDPGVSFSENCVSIVTGINEPANNKLFAVYPNPTNGVVYFSEQTNVQVTNAMGQMITDGKNVNTIDISIQPAGIYFVTLTHNDGKIVHRSKIVKE